MTTHKKRPDGYLIAAFVCCALSLTINILRWVMTP
jgi:hypothetical protein